MAISLDHLMSIYRELKAHDDKIMADRPSDHPRGDWRMKHPAPVQSSFRVYSGKKQFMGRINYDTAPFFEIWTLAAKPKLVERVDLRSPGEALDAYSLPAANDMVNWEFAAIRKRLGLTQAQLAPVLDYELPTNVSAMERETNPRAIPSHIARLMRAYDTGFRPSDWPA